MAILCASSLPAPNRLLSRHDRGDITEYFDYTQRTYGGSVPYRDFVLEYPPGFLPVILAAGPADKGFYDRFRLEMLGFGAVVVLLLVAALQRVGARVDELAAAALLFATLPLTLAPSLVFERFDLWPAALALVAVVSLLGGRRRLGLAALGVGAAAKLYPLALVPLAILTRRGRAHVPRDLAVVAAAALVLVLPFAVVAPRGVAHVGRLLVRRPLHVESLGGTLLLAAHRVGVYRPTIALSFAGSWDLAGPAAKIVAIVGSLAEAAALVAVWLAFARGPRGPRELLLAAAASVVGFVAFGKVLSPQYLVWVAASVPLVLGRLRLFVLGATLAATLATRYVYVDAYDGLLRAGRVSWLMLGRNLLLVAIFGALLVELALRARGGAAGPQPRPASARSRVRAGEP